MCYLLFLNNMNCYSVENDSTLKVDVNPNGKSKLSWNPVTGATTYSIAVGYGGKGIGHTTETSYETVLDVGDYSLYMAAWNGDKLIMTSALLPVSVPFPCGFGPASPPQLSG